ncbi:MAG TPA: hypothetical protein VEI97_19680, partial [bacterium]|nr:hypothetical protein [bacterium]
TLTAELTPWRDGAAFQGNLYDLDTDAFQNSESFRITGIRVDPDGNPIIDYTHAHPFPAPDFTAAVTATNRADLGYTGKVLFLADVPAAQVPANTYFGDVVVNPRLVVDADGYAAGGDLLVRGAGRNTTAHPYKLMVDELQNNRIGITNGGQVTGNYDPAAGGWQRANAGPNRDRWTGYDYLHQGQTARGRVTIAKAAFEAGQAIFDVALLIQYSDPRGGRDRALRMPQEPADVLKFAYRLPHAALDVSKVAPGGVSLETVAGSNAALSIRIRDWDARASVSTQSDIGLEPDVSKVLNSAPGSPTVAVSVPALASGVITASEATPPMSGHPGDELTFNATITNSLGTAPPGTAYGLIGVEDPQNGNDTGYHFGVDPLTLAGDPDRALPLITYQAFQIQLANPPANSPSCGSTAINGSGQINPGGDFTVNLSSITDPDSTSIGVQFAYTGPSEGTSSTVTLPKAGLPLETMFNPFTDSRLTTPLDEPAAIGTYQLSITLTDGASPETVCGPYTFTVADPAPGCGRGISLSEDRFFVGEVVDFAIDLSPITDPGNSGTLAVTFRYTGPENDITDTIALSQPLSASFNPFTSGALTTPLDRPTATGAYTLTVAVDDGENPVVNCSDDFTIAPIGDCGVPQTTPDITTAPVFGQSRNINLNPATWYNFYTTIDFAAFKDGTPGYVLQRYDNGKDPDNGAVTDFNLWRFPAPGASGAAVKLTNYITAGNQVSQLEIDKSGRLIYVYRPTDDAWGPDTLYTNPNVLIHWADYTGATLATEGGAVSHARPVVALALDVDDSLWVIDRDNILSHYSKLPEGYSLVPSDTVDLGAVLGIGLSTVVCDFVVNHHNRAKYILTNSGPTRNGRLYRLECGGTLWTGGTNPANFPLSTGAQFPNIPDGGDIDIDQVGDDGEPLDGEQDAQIVVFHSVGTGGLYIFNSELEQTAASTGGTRSGVRGVVAYSDNYAISNEFDPAVTAAPWAFHDDWTLPAAWK